VTEAATILPVTHVAHTRNSVVIGGLHINDCHCYENSPHSL
jgi:hypothetical protein